MGSRIQCFWLSRSEFGEEVYRRWNMGECPNGYYHNAEVLVSSKVPWTTEDADGIGSQPDEALRADPRWPQNCSCGFAFSPEDHWQHLYHRLFQRGDTGELVTLGKAPVGAMWDADWMSHYHKGPDGLCLVVRTPGGDWIIDAKSRDGKGWTRTGTAPNITANPSILIGSVREGEPDKYHGWLRDGFLVEC